MLKRIKMLGLVLVVAGTLVGCNEVKPIDIQDTQQVQEMQEKQEKKDAHWAANQLALAKPEKVAEDLFDEIKKGVYEANIKDMFYYGENGYPLTLTLTETAQQEGDPAEDELVYIDIYDLYWKTITDAEVIFVDDTNEYEQYVTLDIKHQDLATIIEYYPELLYGCYEMETLYLAAENFKRELCLETNKTETTITITMINPMLMQKHGLAVDLPEVKDEWIISNWNALDNVLTIPDYYLHQ